MAKVSIIGSIKEFESSHDNWLTYMRRIDAWLRVNKIEEEQKVDVLIALGDVHNCQHLCISTESTRGEGVRGQRTIFKMLINLWNIIIIKINATGR